VGEEKALKKSGGIWKRLICDVDEPGLVSGDKQTKTLDILIIIISLFII
jgi:hypothetical protein